jgi:hypothetical protein
MSSQYLEYLSFLHLDPTQEKYSSNFRAVNTGSVLPFCNRVFVPESMSALDCLSLKSFYGSLPFTIWMGESNTAGHDSAEKIGLNFRVSYPMMVADLQQLDPYPEDSDISVRQIVDPHDILTFWVSLAAKAFSISLPDFKKFIEYLLSTQQAEQMQFYAAYYKGVPAATAMLILRDGVADMHWVGTLADYRQKGLGYAVSCYPLHEVKSKVDKVVLFASEMGRPVYEKLGFSVLESCSVYDLQMI